MACSSMSQYLSIHHVYLVVLFLFIVIILIIITVIIIIIDVIVCIFFLNFDSNVNGNMAWQSYYMEWDCGGGSRTVGVFRGHQPGFLIN